MQDTIIELSTITSRDYSNKKYNTSSHSKVYLDYLKPQLSL